MEKHLEPIELTDPELAAVAGGNPIEIGAVGLTFGSAPTAFNNRQSGGNSSLIAASGGNTSVAFVVNGGGTD
jgi:hypothetical protein